MHCQQPSLSWVISLGLEARLDGTRHAGSFGDEQHVLSVCLVQSMAFYGKLELLHERVRVV